MGIRSEGAMGIQATFAELEYGAKKKTRREKFWS